MRQNPVQEHDADGPDAVSMPLALVSELDGLIRYLWPDEAADYESIPPARRRGHIFRTLLMLRQWTDSQLAPMPE